MDELPRTWSKQEVLDAFKISSDTLDKLCRDRKVGHYKAGRERRFFAENISQIRETLEVKPAVPYTDNLTRLGVSEASARRRATARFRQKDKE